jgi:hypothetical protein
MAITEQNPEPEEEHRPRTEEIHAETVGQLAPWQQTAATERRHCQVQNQQEDRECAEELPEAIVAVEGRNGDDSIQVNQRIAAKTKPEV